MDAKAKKNKKTDLKLTFTGANTPTDMAMRAPVSPTRDVLSTQNNYRSLSVKDLLEARDSYHYHLLNKPNVVGTAIGLYLIRKSDQELPATREGQRQNAARTEPVKKPRTFENSEVRSYSWPCVLALVSEWVDEDEFGAKGRLKPQDMVPKTLYLPDGRMVPVCVVKVDRAQPDSGRLPQTRWPGGRFGPGMAISVDHQGVERHATIGCLVTDGHSTYALTSRHASGAAGQDVRVVASGQRVPIGFTSDKQLTRLPFEEVYTEFPARKTYVNMDAGLIDLDDIRDWTTTTYGLGVTGAVADLNAMNITLRLIDAAVVAAGAASGRLEGRIKGLFYRYRSIGGYDYVSDFLIAPRDLTDARTTPSTRAGDSGAVWHLVVRPEPAPGANGKDAADEYAGELRPLAMEWGGQAFGTGGAAGRYTFALATSLTTICKALDVELVTGDRTGVNPFWGRFGHYSIAAAAIEALPNDDLKAFMTANLDRITFDHFTAKEMTEYLKEAAKNGDYVPLADVPDEIWKKHVSKPGGRDNKFAGSGRTTGPEHPVHYADIDVPDANGITLRQHSLQPQKLTVAFWKQFYDGVGSTEPRDRGLLPFRVQQFHTAMKNFAQSGQAVDFLAAAGIVAHYVGDACQPLHGSQYADGYAEQPMTVTHHRRGTGEEYTEESHVGAGVHSAYETKMLDRYDADISAGMAQINTITGALPTAGPEAAMEVVKLMDRVATAIPPADLVDAYVAAGGKPVVATQDALWQQFGPQTISVMMDGAQVLAKIWAGAWQNHAIAQQDLVSIAPDALRTKYEDVTFVPSLYLDDPALPPLL